MIHVITEKNQILFLHEDDLVFFQSINFFEVSNHALKKTRDCNGDYADLDKFTYIQARLAIFRILCINLAYAESEAYSEALYIQNFGISESRDLFRILAYLELEVYSKPC